MNRIINKRCQWIRSKLHYDVVAYNNNDFDKRSLESETVYKASELLVHCRHQPCLKDASDRTQNSMTEDQWDKFLVKHGVAIANDTQKGAMAELAKKMEPIQAAIESKQLRRDMTRRVKCMHNKCQDEPCSFRLGNIVICTNRQ